MNIFVQHFLSSFWAPSPNHLKRETGETLNRLRLTTEELVPLRYECHDAARARYTRWYTSLSCALNTPHNPAARALSASWDRTGNRHFTFLVSRDIRYHAIQGPRYSSSRPSFLSAGSPTPSQQHIPSSFPPSRPHYK